VTDGLSNLGLGGAAAGNTDPPIANAAPPSPPPMTREQAYARKEELWRDQKWLDRYRGGDKEAAAEANKIFAAMAGATFNVQRDGISSQQIADALQRQNNVSPEVARQGAELAPVTGAEKAEAERLYKQLSSSAEWRTRYFQGDKSAAAQMAAISIIRVSPLKE
jgi:hypothetical protein